MISKTHRLTEREVKKVLRKAKPFFSYGIVLNYSKNRLSYNRFSIVLSAKSVTNNVTRNFFRRRFFDEVFSLCGELGENPMGTDFVFVVKKQTKLDKKDDKILSTFKKDIHFLLSKVNK